MSRGARSGLLIRIAAALATTAMMLGFGPQTRLSAQNLPSSPPLPPVLSPGGAPDTGADETLPPYEAQLERLSELLGTLTYLRSLCARGDANEWRNRMANLLDAEAKGEHRRNRLAGAFNRGYRGYAATYHSCTPSAELAMNRSLTESDRLARDLTARYSGT